MPLTKAQRALLHDAFSNAFNHAELAELVQVCFGVDMYKHVAHGSINAEVTELIAWAGRGGKLRALVEGACERSHLHADLRDLCAAVPGWDLDTRFPPGDRGQEPWLFLNVPPRPNLVLGRDDLLRDLVDRLTSGQSAALSADGLPGVGKTTLAIALAHDTRVQAHFADGVLWAGLGPNANVAAIQQAWADALGADLTGLGDPLQRRDRLNAAMADRRLLLVLDDAWQLGDANALRGSGPHVAHVLTTRSREIARAFAGAGGMVKVPVLADADAWALLAELAPDACATDDVDARALLRQLGGLPLSIRVAGGALAAVEEPHLFTSALETLARGLQDARVRHAQRGPRAGSETEETLEAVIGWSVERLGEAERDAFYALGAFAPLPATFGVEAACAVAECAEDALQTLLKRNLLSGEEAGLALHQEIAAYAAARMPPEAVLRHRAHYLVLANADRGDWQAIEAAYDQIAHAWQAISSENGDVLRVYYFTFKDHLFLRGLHSIHITWIKRVLITSEDPVYRSALLDNMAQSYSAIGDTRWALEYLNEALLLQRQIGDRGGEATTLNSIGEVYRSLGEPTGALQHYESALLLMRATAVRNGEAMVLNNMGLVYHSLGEPKRALEIYSESLALRRQVGDRGGEASALNNIGRVYTDLGQKAQALKYYQQALPLYRQVGDRGGEATALGNIGSVYSDLGNYEQALKYHKDSLELEQLVENRAGEATSLHEIGLVYARMGDPKRALEYFEQALELERQVSARFGEAQTLNNIGMVYAALGEQARALEYYEQVLTLRQQMGDRWGEATTLANIGGVYAVRGEPKQALEYLEQALPLLRQIGDRSGLSFATLSLVVVYIQLGDRKHLPDAVADFLRAHDALDPRVAAASGLTKYADQFRAAFGQG